MSKTVKGVEGLSKKYKIGGPNLVPIQLGGSKPPLFWVHGDRSDVYLPHYLGADQELYAFKHQGRHGERARFTKVETIAAYYLQQVRTIQAKGPYFLGGYSFGGTVAFEMAQQLRTRAENVALLFMIDSLSPRTRVQNSSSASISRSSANRQDIHRHLDIVFHLKPQHAAMYIAVRVSNKLKDRMRNLIAALKKILIRSYCVVGRPLPYFLRNQYILKIYFDAIATYDPSPYPGHAIYIRSAERSPDHASNWRTLVQGGLEIYEVPACDHMDIIKDNNAPLWVETLRNCLERSHETWHRELKK